MLAQVFALFTWEEVVRLEGEVRRLTKAGNELGLELQGLRDKEREFEREQAKLQQQLASALAADKSSHLKLENECARARQDLTHLRASFKSEKEELEKELELAAKRSSSATRNSQREASKKEAVGYLDHKKMLGLIA